MKFPGCYVHILSLSDELWIRTREPVCSRVDRYIMHYTDLVVVPVVGPQLQDAVLQAGQLDRRGCGAIWV